MDESKICMLSILFAFFKEHDIEADKRIMMTISVRKYLHMKNFIILKSTWHLFVLSKCPLTVKVENVPETVQSCVLNLLTATYEELVSL